MLCTHSPLIVSAMLEPNTTTAAVSTLNMYIVSDNQLYLNSLDAYTSCIVRKQGSVVLRHKIKSTHVLLLICYTACKVVHAYIACGQSSTSWAYCSSGGLNFTTQIMCLHATLTHVQLSSSNLAVLYAYMYNFVYVYIRVYVCMYICMYLCIYVFQYVYVCVQVYVCIHDIFYNNRTKFLNKHQL